MGKFSSIIRDTNSHNGSDFINQRNNLINDHFLDQTILDHNFMNQSILKIDGINEKKSVPVDGACFTMDGKFDRWGGNAKGEDAPVTFIKAAGDKEGIRLKNNASDFSGKDITVKQFLKRAQRVYAEGGDATLGKYYAHAQDNKRKKLKGKEADNFQGMSTQDFDVSHQDPKYTNWNNSRGVGYNDLSKLNTLENANHAIKAVADLLMGTSSDPTDGATQWRGHGVKEETTLDDKKVNWKVKWTADMDAAKSDASILKRYRLPAGGIVESYIIIENKGRYQLFFKFK